MISKDDFIAACETILDIDSDERRLRDLIKEHDEKFGNAMFTDLPSHSFKMRRLAIQLLARAAGIAPVNSVIDYFFDECVIMKMGGSINYPGGKKFMIVTPADLWEVVVYEIENKVA